MVGISFMYMVYKTRLLCINMSDGAAYSYRPHFGGGRDHFHIQKKCNHWYSRIWGSYIKHCDHSSERHECDDPVHENIPVADSLERSLFKRGPSRREYQICILEARDSYKVKTNTAEFAQSIECECENVCCKSPRFVFGNKQTSHARVPAGREETEAKRVCRHNRSASNDRLCCYVFQTVGSDLIAPWLTPEEVYSSEIAFSCSLDWGQAWHGGRVRDRAVASQIQFLLDRKMCVHSILSRFDHDRAFSALWYLIDCDLFTNLCNQYKHYKSIRMLCRLIN